MIKAIEMIVAVILLIFSFFAGVKYSDSIKEHVRWLFEIKDEEESELPSLFNKDHSDETKVFINKASNSQGKQRVLKGKAQDAATDKNYNINSNLKTQSSQPQPELVKNPIN